ncbi:hypothetical protein TNCV_2914201 [Trichonephila clavipes]|nr:hypothetical protein TNCV_2914201 [Trichonephila clavipes]
MCLRPSIDHVQMMMHFGDLELPAWGQYHLFGIDLTARRSLSGYLQRSTHLRLRLPSFKPANGSPSQNIF